MKNKRMYMCTDGIERAKVRIEILVDSDLLRKIDEMEKSGMDWRGYAQQGALHEIEHAVINHDENK